VTVRGGAGQERRDGARQRRAGGDVMMRGNAAREAA
jgi:hypothetical protein